MNFKKFLKSQNETTKPVEGDHFFIGRASDIKPLLKKKAKELPIVKKIIGKLSEKVDPSLLHNTDPKEGYDELFIKHHGDFKNERGHFDYEAYHLAKSMSAHTIPGMEHVRDISHINNPDHAEAIHNYSGLYSGNVNRKLLREHRMYTNRKDMHVKHSMPKDTDERNIINHTNKHLSSAIAANKTTKDLHVYSGLGFTPENYAHKNVFHMPAYTSTSLSKKLAKNWTPLSGGNVTNSKHVYDKRTNKQVHYKSKKLIPSYDYHGFPTKNAYVYTHMIHIHIPEGSHALYTHINYTGDETKVSNIHLKARHPSEQEVILHKGAKLHIHKTPEVDHINRKVIWHAKLVHDGIKKTKFGDLLG